MSIMYVYDFGTLDNKEIKVEKKKKKKKKKLSQAKSALKIIISFD